MKSHKDPVILYAGRFNPGEMLSGPEKTAKRIFMEHSGKGKAFFIQYFFDGRLYGIKQKLFGEELNSYGENETVLTLGLFRIFSALRKLKPDIIHIITFERFAGIFILYSMIYSTKIIYNVHGIVSYENNELKKVPFLQKLKDRFCERMFIKRSARLIFNSENTIDLAEKYFKVVESKAVILPNGIDAEFMKNRVSGNRDLRLRAVFINKNEFSKTGIEFLNTLLNYSDIRLELFIISESKPDTITNDKVNITYVSPMPAAELAEFYRDKDIFLSLNLYDTFSISTAEAMASGLIPVITSQTGISRYVHDGNSGFIVEYGDHIRLNEILKIIEGYELPERELLQNSAAGIYGSLAWKNVYEMYLDLYMETAA